MIHCRNGVLPYQLLLGNERAKITRQGAHIAVRQLEPRTSECVRELIRIRVEVPRNFFVGRVEPQREVGGQHGRRKALRRVVGIRHCTGARVTLRLPLVRTGRALGQFPFVAEQVLEEVVAPLRRRAGPCDFQAAADRVAAYACVKAAHPAEALLLDACGFRHGTDVRWIAGTVGFAEGVTAGDERNRLFVVHRHASEGLADIPRRSDRIRLAVGTFRIDVNQTHLHGSERIFEIAVSGVAIVSQPGAFRSPVDVFFRFPDVLTPAGETEGLESHRLQSDVAGENHQSRPRRVSAHTFA